MSTGWGFEIVGEEGFTPLDDATVRALSALGAADVNNDGVASNVSDADTDDDANLVDFMVLHAPDGTPEDVVRAVADGIIKAVTKAADGWAVEAADRDEDDAYRVLADQRRAYRTPDYYLTLDEYLGVLREAVIASSFPNPHQRLHPEDLFVAVASAADSAYAAFDFIASKGRH